MKMQTPATSADAVPDPADIAIAQAETRQRRRRRWLLIIGGGGLLASYPLSVGPLTFLHSRGLIHQKVLPAVEAFYLPLNWAHSRSEWVKAFYDCYTPFFEG